MRRLVIALTGLLALLGAVVVVAYLLLFGATVDRAAGVAPADTTAYLSVYLAPSSGQQRNLGELLGRLPGFTDLATLPTKLDELAQRFLGSAGLDYHRDIAPWLGDELAVAVRSPAAPETLLIAAVRDPDAAQAAIARIAVARGGSPAHVDYQGVTITTAAGAGGTGASFAIVDRELVVSANQAGVRAAIDAATGRSSSLADAARFRDAMASLPADRVASVYLDIGAALPAGGSTSSLSGLSYLALAAVLEPDGIRLTGSAPIDRGWLGAGARAILDLAGQPSDLAAWMPEQTEAEVVLLGARQGFDALVAELGSTPGGDQIASALTQLRALTALGLGIDLDRDLLPLFDHEAALAITGLGGSTPRGQLLLRPSDPTAAASTLQRLVGALRARGAQTSEATVGGVTVETITISQLGTISFATDAGVIIAGLSFDDVRAALEAHARGATLAASPGYAAAFRRAGTRSGYELFVAGAHLADLLAGVVALPGDARDMLSHLDGFALAVPATQTQLEIHAALTVH